MTQEKNMDSIEVGREYRHQRAHNTIPVIVRAVSESHVGFVENEDGGINRCWLRDEFLHNYEPIPSDLPKTCGECDDFSTDACCRPICVDGHYREANARADTCFKPPKPAPEPWKPRAGEQCLAGDLLVIPIGLDPVDGRWVCRTVTGGDYVGRDPACLRPLPPEPPMKVGQHVKMMLEGEVLRVLLNSMTVKLDGGDVVNFIYRHVKLVPTQEGGKP